MKKYKFKTKIEAGDGGGAYVLFPYDTEKEFDTKGKVPVKATFNGETVRPADADRHCHSLSPLSFFSLIVAHKQGWPCRAEICPTWPVAFLLAIISKPKFRLS